MEKNMCEEKKITKTCPFKNGECTPDCMLYIAPEELNENVRTRLKSIGVISEGGDCSLKNIALANIRNMYENTSVKRF